MNGRDLGWVFIIGGLIIGQADSVVISLLGCFTFGCGIGLLVREVS